MNIKRIFSRKYRLRQEANKRYDSYIDLINKYRKYAKEKYGYEENTTDISREAFIDEFIRIRQWW